MGVYHTPIANGATDVSKGNPIVRVRLTPDLIARIDDEVKLQNQTRAAEPYDRSAWIRQAIAQRLAHLARSRRPRRWSGAPPIGGAPHPTQNEEETP